MTPASASADILRRAAAAAGIDPTDAAPLRTGSNDIFELRNGIIARIGKPNSIDTAERELQVSRWLNVSGIPTVEASESRYRPTVVDNRPVTWWRLIPDHRPSTPAELGAALRRLHVLDPPTTFELPQYQPFARVLEELSAATAIGDEDQKWLIQHYSTLRQQYEQLPPAERKAVIHGDAWQGNLIVSHSGTPVFLDLDKVSIGRPEWDLVQLAVDHTDFTRLTAADYRSFVAAYGGHDMTTSTMFRLFADIQEIRWTTFAIGLSHRDESARAEAAHRIACLRGYIAKPWVWNAL
ncbi:phosphotransferase enzyme family protein [Nocardia flavorosea]|uniref:Phosphotransferase n=1 Tax=Nocardia flavorosea TaxID=53429 RepID=A0A846YBV3_9NOCA|nr:phosphotransferase [Nocardia flavorosea]NKY55234.1 phosphotransferase [Nocardia flavorosea]